MKAEPRRTWHPPAREDARAWIKGKGRRLTPHREAVYEYLKGVRHHPTAEEIYVAVKQQIPRLSLATIYNALELLVTVGLASKITFGNASTRYDIRTDVHSHTRCLGCGRLEDVDVIPDQRWIGQIRVSGFRVADFRFELLGRCARCSSSA